MKHTIFTALVILAASSIGLGGCGGNGSNAQAQAGVFTLSSPDLVNGTFDAKFILNLKFPPLARV